MSGVNSLARKNWSQSTFRYREELAVDIRHAMRRTGLKEQELLREAVRRGLPLIEDKVI